MAAPHLEQVRDMFERYDVDHDDSLTINEVATLLAELGNKITSLPAVRCSVLLLRRSMMLNSPLFSICLFSLPFS
jgi:hypothetical protein